MSYRRAVGHALRQNLSWTNGYTILNTPPPQKNFPKAIPTAHQTTAVAVKAVKVIAESNAATSVAPQTEGSKALKVTPISDDAISHLPCTTLSEGTTPTPQVTPITVEDISHLTIPTTRVTKSSQRVSACALVVSVIAALVFLYLILREIPGGTVSNRREPSRNTEVTTLALHTEISPLTLHSEQPTFQFPKLPSIDIVEVARLRSKDPLDPEVLNFRIKIRDDLKEIDGTLNQLIAAVGGQETYDALPVMRRQDMLFGHYNPIIAYVKTPANLYRAETPQGRPIVGFNFLNLTKGVPGTGYFFESGPGNFFLMGYPEPGMRHAHVNRIVDLVMLRLGFTDYAFAYHDQVYYKYRLHDN